MDFGKCILFNIFFYIMPKYYFELIVNFDILRKMKKEL